MSHQVEPADIHGLSQHIAPDNNDSSEMEKKTEDKQEAACILDGLRSGERLLYLRYRRIYITTYMVSPPTLFNCFSDPCQDHHSK